MITGQTEQQKESIVDYKVRRRVAQKALHDIQREVDEIEQQLNVEKKAKRIILPLLLLVGAVLITLALWPDALRLLSSLINPN